MSLPLPYQFIPGWSPELAQRGRAKFFGRGQRFASSFNQFLGDNRPLPPGFSLSGWIKIPYNQGQVGSCFPPGTHIFMADRSQRLIEKVQKHDRVLTAEGNIGTVMETMVRQENDSVIVVNFEDRPSLLLTAEHPVRINNGMYIEAAKLTPQHQVWDWQMGQLPPGVVDRPHVHSIAKRSYRGPVYNLHVEGDNSYVANGIGVHNCFANMSACILQIMLYASVANGADPAKKAFNPSRRLAWYQCRKLDGSLGSRQDGGSIVNSFACLGPAPEGVGDCTEEEWPYKPDHNWLETTPPANVLQDAGATRISQIAELPFNADTFKRSIFNTHPVGIGIDWPGGWDSAVDSTGRTTGIGHQIGGHALAIIGWLDDWDGHTYWEIENSHGAIYSPPPTDIQQRIQGYAPPGLASGHVYSFWCRDDYLQYVLNQRDAESYNAAGVDGYEPVAINVPSIADGFVV